MTATTSPNTIDRDVLKLAQETKAKLDERLRVAKTLVAALPETEAGTLHAIDLIGEPLAMGYRLVGPLLTGVEQLLDENDRLKSMANHPAGKGRCRCAGPLTKKPEGARGI